MRNVTVAAIQMQMTAGVSENINKAEQLVRKAAEQGAQIILLPELFERPYFCQQRQYDFYDYATAAAENPAVQRFQQVARDLKVVMP
ncbi:MAG: N-carbamoylputrescine amidase, partial [Selenomonas sp.]|nr:N-carbamoylputrescine amidase [Selenomonas sp.]